MGKRAISMRRRHYDVQTAISPCLALHPFICSHFQAQVASDKAEDKLEALTDLREFFVDQRESHHIRSLDDRTLHALLETIFRVVRSDIPLFAGSNNASQSRLSARTSACASLLRTSIEITLQRLRYRSVRATIEHITQTLSLPGCKYYEPLTLDYLRSLRMILNCKVHVEHLSADDYVQLYDFLLMALEDMNLDEGVLSESEEQHEWPTSMSGTTGQDRKTKNRSSDMIGRDRRNLTYKHLQPSNEDIVSCLLCVVTASQYLTKATSMRIFDNIMGLFVAYPHVSILQTGLFELIDLLLGFSNIENIELSGVIMDKVIDHIRIGWERASSVLKISMLSILCRGRLQISRLLSSTQHSHYRDRILALLVVMKDQYSQRRSRDQLLLDNLNLHWPDEQANRPPLSMPAFSLCSQSTRSEEPWCTLELSATMMIASQVSRPEFTREDSGIPPSESSQVKRRRIEHYEPLLTSGGSTGVATVFDQHIIPFYYYQRRVNTGSMRLALATLEERMSESGGAEISWAALTALALAYQPEANSPSLKIPWKRLWVSLFRFMGVPKVCKFACHAMAVILTRSLLHYEDLVYELAPLSNDKSHQGPATINDSTILFWISIITSAYEHSASASRNLSLRALAWVYHTWQPANISNSTHISHISRELSASKLCRLLSRASGIQGPNIHCSSRRGIGQLSKVHLMSERTSSIQHFLCDEDERLDSVVHVSQAINDLQPAQELQENVDELSSVLGKLCMDMLHNYESIDHTQPNTSLCDIMVCLVQILAVGYSVDNGISHSTRAPGHCLRGTLCQIKAVIKRQFLNAVYPLEVMEAFLDALGDLIGPKSIVNGEQSYVTDPTLLAICEGFDLEFWTNSKLCSPDRFGHKDLTDSENDGFEVREVNLEESLFENNFHDAFEAKFSNSAVRACTQSRISLLAAKGYSQKSASLRLESYIDMTTLQKKDFILRASFFVDLLDYRLIDLEEDVDTLLQYVQQVILRPYEIRQSPVCLEITLQILKSLCYIWAHSDQGDLRVTSVEICTWFVTDFMASTNLTESVTTRAVDLLLAMLRLQTKQLATSLFPSSRTLIFQLLQNSNLLTKSRIGSMLGQFLHLYAAKEHSTIIEDIIELLPRDPSWIEGIAVRLQILTSICMSTHTILRRCVYAIFETAGRVPTALKLAKRCLAQIADHLELKGSASLFGLFQSQILYTWLERQDLRSLPFAVFNFHNLKDFLIFVKEEIVAQVMMRGKQEEIDTLEIILQQPFRELILLSFARTAAYCIARDIAVPPAENHNAPQAENRLRITTGKEDYTKLVKSHFPTIVAHLFAITERDDQILKAFEKDKTFAAAGSIFRIMDGQDNVSSISSVWAQPSFKAKYLPAEIKHTCLRASLIPISIWSAPFYITIFRQILNLWHPALGPDVASGVLQKIKNLICLAGSVAVTGYPLAMGLNTIRPLVAISSCTREGILISKYLHQEGTQYLMESPSWSLDLILKTVLSESPLPNTVPTDELFCERSTLAYKVWLLERLSIYFAQQDNSTRDFIACIQRNVLCIMGSSLSEAKLSRDSLLIVMLESLHGEHTYILPSTIQHVLAYITKSFESPGTTLTQYFESDNKTGEYAPIIWKLCRSKSSSAAFSIWCARLLGRAYFQIGPTTLFRTEETQNGMANYQTLEFKGACKASRKELLDLMVSELGSDIHMVVKQTEIIMSQVFAMARSSVDRKFLETNLSAQFVDAFTLPANMTKLEEDAYSGSDVLENMQPLGTHDIETGAWIGFLTIFLTNSFRNDNVIWPYGLLCGRFERVAPRGLPALIHIALSATQDGDSRIRDTISNLCNEVFEKCVSNTKYLAAARTLIEVFLYLNPKPLPKDIRLKHRSSWVDVNMYTAAVAAQQCDMGAAALYFFELHESERKRDHQLDNHRARQQYTLPQSSRQALHSIYDKLTDSDNFHGFQKASDIGTIMRQSHTEREGWKNLVFKSALYDSEIRYQTADAKADIFQLTRTLQNLDLNGLTLSLPQDLAITTDKYGYDAVIRAARQLEQWSLPVPKNLHSSQAFIFRALGEMTCATSAININNSLNRSLLECINSISSIDSSGTYMVAMGETLGVLTEIGELAETKGLTEFEAKLKHFEERTNCMQTQRSDAVKEVQMCRQIMFSSIRKNVPLQKSLDLSLQDASSLDAKAMLAASRTFRTENASQSALTLMTSLNGHLPSFSNIGVDVYTATQFESSHILWSLGETDASVSVLTALYTDMTVNFSRHNTVVVGKPEVLACLVSILVDECTHWFIIYQGHRTAEARSQRAEEILDNILSVAVQQLGGTTLGREAGAVFYEFASFCDRQLQNPDSMADLNRVKKLRDRKETEIIDLENMIRGSKLTSKEKDALKLHKHKAKQWFDIDDQEYRRLMASRLSLLSLSLEHYLRCLCACDDFDNKVLRFSSLWLENQFNEEAQTAVASIIGDVPTRKFAALINQWTSRLSSSKSKFASILSAIVYQICVDHPYHGMYQVFASSKSKGGRDGVSMARNAAANSIVDQLRSNSRSQRVWISIHNTNVTIVRFAMERLEDPSCKSGAKLLLKSSTNGRKVEEDVLKSHIPPLTIEVALRNDCDYSGCIYVAKFMPSYTIASGISMPKIVTVVGSDGNTYKQLFKSGNDDLRQDVIMEQVFAAVSILLRSTASTLRRSLGIRTYKVQALTTTAGVIEFVQNTLPLHEYLLPAHQRYYPKDMKPNIARKSIQEAQNTSLQQRLTVFRKVCDHVNPVLRYYFQENFTRPEIWYARRLAYTRSTATISILGHVVGLGDRHGHNILLDRMTGEVVHIDLGIAFEQGRVLPIPELVPFRLTRDIVDGMGITGVEGVFRKCCELTLEALRDKSSMIMNILDVLRYDPLYSWSLSPLRLKRLQDFQVDEVEKSLIPSLPGDTSKPDEMGEAERALLVVAKKLSRTLSVQAAVNELIQQATDETNLAQLFCGWAAYA